MTFDDLPPLSQMTLDILKHELVQLSELHVLTEAFLDNAVAEFQSKHHEAPADIPDEERHYRDENAHDHYVQLVDGFPSRLREGLLLTAVSILEHHLDALCSELMAEKGVSLKPGDLRHSGLRRSQVYIKQVLELPFPDYTREWDHLLLVGKIRNRFAHAGGYCDEKLRPLVEKQPDLSITTYGEIRLTAHFMRETIGAMGVFGETLTEMLRHRGPEGA